MILPLSAALLGIVAFLPLTHTYWFGLFFLTPLFIWYIQERSFTKLLLGTLLFRLLFALGTVYYTLEPIAWGISLLIFLGLPVTIYGIRAVYKKLTGRAISASMLLISIPFIWTLWDTITAIYSPLPTTIILAGNALGASPFAGLATMGGVIGLTAFVTIINALMTTYKVSLHNASKQRKLARILAIGTCIVLALAISSIILTRRTERYQEKTRRLSILAMSIQKNITPRQRAELTAVIQKTPADIIVFPEKFFEKDGDMPYATMEEMTTDIKQLLPFATSTGVGIFDLKQSDQDKKYGVALLAEKTIGITGIHSKARLSFGGEYWPFGNWHPALYDWVRSRNPDIKNYALFGKQNGYATGEKHVVQSTVAGTPTSIALLVCMEMQYPFDITAYKKQGAQMIINPTSNRWIGTGTTHFLFLANNLRRIESIDAGIPIVVSGIEDIGGVFTPDGKKRAVYYKQTDKGYALLETTISL